VPALSEPLKAEGGTWVSAKARIMILDFKLLPCSISFLLDDSLGYEF